LQSNNNFENEIFALLSHSVLDHFHLWQKDDLLLVLGLSRPSPVQSLL